MKRILLTLTTLFIAFVSYSQVNVDSLNINRYYDNLEDMITIILNKNPSIASYKTYDTYSYGNGYKICFTIFKDDDDRFLDLIFFTNYKEPNNELYEDYWEMPLRRNGLQYQLNRKIVNFETNFSDKYKIIFDDNTFISIEFDNIRIYKETYEGVDYCTRTHYKIFMYDTDLRRYFTCPYFSYEKIDCK